MRVTFARPADREMAYAVVERDDGVVYRLQGGRAGTALPHDIRHLIVERELGVTDGIWGGIAAGAVLDRDSVLRAELLADLVERIAALDDPTPEAIRRLTAAKLSVLRGTAPSPEALATAARSMQVEAARWARLRPGQELQYEWPSPRVRIPRQPRPPGSESGRPRELIDAGPVILRRWRPDDLEAACDAVLASLEHLRPWMLWAADFSRASQAEFLAGTERDWESGVAYNYAMLVDGAIAGSSGLMRRIGPGGMEIGYWVHQSYTRRGLATAAAAVLTGQAFALPGIDRVQIVHDQLNVASGGVPRKLGFRETGQRPLDHRPPGGTGIGVVWEVTRAEWQRADR